MASLRSFRTASVADAESLLARGGALVLDIRDAESFARGHIETAHHVGTSDLPAWLERLPRVTPLLVCCYHGISSQDYARLLTMLGFSEVYSLAGGYEAWRQRRPAATAAAAPAAGDRLRAFLREHGFAGDDIEATIANGTTPLMKACHLGALDIVQDLLSAGANLNARNADGNTALWLACAGEQLGAIDALAAAGIDIDNQNDNGATCLMYAASAGKHRVVEYLLLAGANTALESLDGFTALDMAATIECLTLLRAKKTPAPAAT